MAGHEVRVMAEGQLWWAQASGTGTSWQTASAPASGLFAFVDSFTFTSALTSVVQSDRGVPNHHKVTQYNPIDVTFQIRWTGNSFQAATAAGNSTPLFNLEYRANEPENGNSGRYYQFNKVLTSQNQFTENTDGNTIQFTTQALGMNGPTGSGYVK